MYRTPLSARRIEFLNIPNLKGLYISKINFKENPYKYNKKKENL